MPRLARKQPPRPKYPSAPPVQCQKCHACHAECTSMSPSATPSTQSDGRCRQAQACHANSCRHQSNQARRQCQSRSMSPSATPATQNAHRCGQVPGLPQSMSPSATPGMQTAAVTKVLKRATTPSPVTEVPRLLRRMHVDVTKSYANSRQKCHACHAKWRSMSPSARPAMQTAAAP